MIKEYGLVEKFEKSEKMSSAPDYFKHLHIFEQLYHEAKTLGIFPLKDPLDGIEVDIRLAMVLNVRRTSPEDRF
ncbi:hypothetical protein ACFL9T_18150 [Thermodesulfobacteriota bacterium]